MLLGLGGLVAIIPLGQEATEPAMFLLYRFVLFGLVVVSLWGFRKRGKAPDFSRAFYGMIGAFLALTAVSVWVSPGRNVNGATVWYEHAVFALFFVAMARFGARRSTEWKGRLLVLIIGATLAQLTLALLSGTRPLRGSFVNENHLASYLLVGFAAAAAVAAGHTRISWRLAAGPSALLLFYGITETLSRGATLAAIGIGALTLWTLPRRAALVGAAIITAGVIFIAASNPGLISKFTDRGDVDPYNYARTDIWMSTAGMISDNPVLGVGLARFGDAARRYRFPTENAIGRFMKRQSIAHSEYLHYAAEIGIPATLVLIALLAYLFLILARAHGVPPEAMFLERAALLTMTGVGLHAAVDNNFQAPVAIAALATVSLAGAPLRRTATFGLPATLEMKVVVGIVLGVLFVGSSLIPGLAYYSDSLGHRKRAEGDLDAAGGAHRLALALRPDDSVLLTNVGRVYKDQFIETKDRHLLNIADTFFHRAAEANPQGLAPRQEIARTLILRLTGETGPDRRLHRKLIDVNQAVLDLDPFLPQARMNLAEALRRSGRAEEAYAELIRTVELEPNYVAAYRRLADWAAEAGNLELSRSFLDEIEQIDERYRGVVLLTDYEALILGRPAEGRPREQ